MESKRERNRGREKKSLVCAVGTGWIIRFPLVPFSLMILSLVLLLLFFFRIWWMRTYFDCVVVVVDGLVVVGIVDVGNNNT